MMKRIPRTSAIISAALLLLFVFAGTGYLAWIAWEVFDITTALAAAFYLGFFLFLLHIFVPNAAYRIEYDDEKIISRNFFKKDVTVRKDKDIYYSEIWNKGHVTWTISNEPFFYNSKPRNGFPAIELYDEEFKQTVQSAHCIPFQNVDWDLLTAHYAKQPSVWANHNRIYMLPGFLRELIALELAAIALTGITVYMFHSLDITVISTFLVEWLIFWIGLIAAVITAVKRYRFCCAVSLSETSVTSSLFNKELCTVDLTQTVHYAIFRGAEYGSEGEPYIVISNTWFNYFKVNQNNRSYLSEFDPHTQIAFPYNAETAAICDFDNWHCVGGFGELNMKRSKNSV